MNKRQIDAQQRRKQAEQFLASSSIPDELAWAHMILGLQHEDDLAWEAAVESYCKGVALNPGNPHTQYFCNNNLAFSLIQLGRFEEAEPYCRAAIEIEPERHNAHKNLGLALQGLGQFLDAAKCFATASRIAPADPRAWWFLEQLIESHQEVLSQSGELRLAVERLRWSVNAGGHAQVQ